MRKNVVLSITVQPTAGERCASLAGAKPYREHCGTVLGALQKLSDALQLWNSTSKARTPISGVRPTLPYL